MKVKVLLLPDVLQEENIKKNFLPFFSFFFAPPFFP
jgi:hypothetical protein